MRRKGFTLIELLVVIAIIAILAAMLFPVFARARESARKIQCLANVKNIAMGFQLYLTDYDRFQPSGHSQQNVKQWIDDNCGGCQFDCRSTEMNPYLRVPVILDEYIKNRDVWRCPSAKYSNNSVAINSCTPDWFTVFSQSMANGDCPRPRSCTQPYPSGWGGAITDTVKQAACAFGNGAFDQSIGTTILLRDVKPSQAHDLTKLVVCGDSGIGMESDRTSQFAYPDQSRFEFLLLACGGGGSGNCSSDPSSCGNAAVAATCSPLSLCFGGDGKFTKDVSYRKTFSRHMGGSNLGFADGHAAWMDAERILFGGSDHSHYAMHPQLLYGVLTCFNPTDKSRWEKPVTVDPTAGDI